MRLRRRRPARAATRRARCREAARVVARRGGTVDEAASSTGSARPRRSRAVGPRRRAPAVAPSVPARRRAMALVGARARPRRVPRRRHGARQDAPGARAPPSSAKRPARRLPALLVVPLRSSPTGRPRPSASPRACASSSRTRRPTGAGAQPRARVDAPEAIDARRRRVTTYGSLARDPRGCASASGASSCSTRRRPSRTRAPSRRAPPRRSAPGRASRSPARPSRTASAISGRSSTSSRPGLLGSAEAVRRTPTKRMAARETRRLRAPAQRSSARTSCGASRPTSASSPTCPTRPRSRPSARSPSVQAALYQRAVDDLGAHARRARGDRAARRDPRGAAALQADLQPPVAVARRRRVGPGGQRQARAPARDLRAHRRAAGEGARLHPVPRDDRRRSRASCASVFGREGLVLHGSVPRQAAQGAWSTPSRTRRGRRSSCSRSRPAARAST